MTLPSQRVAPLLSPCRLCEIRCGVDRLADERGPCGVGRQARVYNAFVHLGEEPSLTPCFTVFLTGCNFRCVYCSDGDEVEDPSLGRPLDPEALARRVASHPEVRTVQFVGGLPDVNLLAVAECAERLPPGLPVVLNTNGYFTPEALKAMGGWVDVLLIDLKYGPGDCARLLSRVERYWELVTRNLQEADRSGFRVLVRHLLLPGHLECCTRPVLRFLGETLPSIELNLMTGYRPLHEVTSALGPLAGRLANGVVPEILSWPEISDLRGLQIDGQPAGFNPKVRGSSPAYSSEKSGSCSSRNSAMELAASSES